MLDDTFRCLQWRSRRGMLELDVLLQPFTRETFPQMAEEDQVVYARLLECEDPDLFNWFMSGQRPEDPDLSRMVDRILDCGRHSSDSV